jgi:hypothetical protein
MRKDHEITGADEIRSCNALLPAGAHLMCDYVCRNMVVALEERSYKHQRTRRNLPAGGCDACHPMHEA